MRAVDRKDRDNINGSLFGRCVQLHCTGRLKQLLDSTVDVTVTPVHTNHAPNPMLNVVERIKAAICNRAVDVQRSHNISFKTIQLAKGLKHYSCLISYNCMFLLAFINKINY
jgi:hypothetical protein